MVILLDEDDDGVLWTINACKHMWCVYTVVYSIRKKNQQPFATQRSQEHKKYMNKSIKKERKKERSIKYVSGKKRDVMVPSEDHFI